MVTWYQLDFAALALIAIVGGGMGALRTFGGMMSDSPTDGRTTQRTGCAMIVIATAVFIVAIYALRHA